MKFHTVVGVVAASFVLAGCGVGKPFVQSGVGTAESAHIVTDSDHLSDVAGWDRRIYIRTVDGTDTHPGLGLMPEEAYLSEGPHKLDIVYMYMGAKASGHLQLVAHRGHEYVIHRQQEGNRMRFWITDGPAGAVVGGIAD